MQAHSAAMVWLLVGIIGIGTWIIRLSFLALLGRVEQVPVIVERILRLIPAAVLSALVVPGLTHSEGSFDLGTPRFLAGAIAAVVAWRTKNVLATIAAGMSVLWITEALL